MRFSFWLYEEKLKCSTRAEIRWKRNSDAYRWNLEMKMKHNHEI
jgi:hypothetical protein